MWVAYIFKVFGAQSCLIVACYVCEKCANFPDSKLVFMISGFKIFPIMLLRELNCGVLSV